MDLQMISAQIVADTAREQIPVLRDAELVEILIRGAVTDGGEANTRPAYALVTFAVPHAPGAGKAQHRVRVAVNDQGAMRCTLL